MEHEQHHDKYDEMFEHLKEEMEDACEYLKESEAADEMGLTYIAKGLRDIAMEEYTHAKFFRNYLMMKHVYHDHEHHAEFEEKWKRLEHKLFD